MVNFNPNVGLGLILMLLGVLGFALRPPQTYFIANNRRLLKCIYIYYIILAIVLLLDGLTSSMEVLCFCFSISSCFCLSLYSTIRYFLTIILFAYTAYGIYIIKRIWFFEWSQLKDILIYGGLIYLIEKDIHLCRVDAINVISSVLAVMVAVSLIYVFAKLKKWGLFMEFENYEIVSIIFFTTFLIGLRDVMNEYKLGSLINILILLLNIYTIYTVSKYTKHFVKWYR